jgi:hypothetical protein
VAVSAAARRGAEIVLGTMPWFVLAGLVEGFVTPRRVGTGLALVVGVSAGALYWILVLWRGRPPQSLWRNRRYPSETSQRVTDSS